MQEEISRTKIDLLVETVGFECLGDPYFSKPSIIESDAAKAYQE